jgi:hypothetical protein
VNAGSQEFEHDPSLDGVIVGLKVEATVGPKVDLNEGANDGLKVGLIVGETGRHT